MTAAELQVLLCELYTAQDEQLREQFARSLPFQDGAFNRWERAQRLGFAAGASIYNSALVFGEVCVGANTWIGPYTVLDGSGAALQIGAHCSISSGVHIYTHDTVRWALSGGVAEKRADSVTISDCVYIGSQSIIAPGVTIGTQVVVAANSFVRSDVPPRTVVGGSPARVIGKVLGEGKDIHWEISA